jgi:hypothetical protein
MNSVTRYLPARMMKTNESSNVNFIPIKTYDNYKSKFKRDTLLLQYAKPLKSDMLVIIPFFNPCNSVRIVQNLFLVMNKLLSSFIPFVVVHCLFPDSNSLMPKSSYYFTVNSSSYAFVKENLANIAIERYRDAYSKFTILDGDIIFDNPTWYDDTSDELEVYDVVQPYTTYHHVNYDFSRVVFSGKGIFSVVDEMLNNVSNVKGHTGFVIAFTKEYVDTVGVPYEALIGGGDTLLCSIALKTILFGNHNNKYFDYLYDKYLSKECVGKTRTKSIEGSVYHLYHNVLSNRQYTVRYNILNRYINDDTPFTSLDDMIYKNDDGVYEWKEDIREAVNHDILNYFSSRQDDDIVV